MTVVMIYGASRIRADNSQPESLPSAVWKSKGQNMVHALGEARTTPIIGR